MLFFCKIPGLVGSHGRYMFNFMKFPNYFTTWLNHFTFTPAVNECSVAPHFCQHLLWSVSFIRSSIFNLYVIISHVVLICIFLMTGAAKHLLMYSFAINMSSLLSVYSNLMSICFIGLILLELIRILMYFMFKLDIIYLYILYIIYIT